MNLREWAKSLTPEQLKAAHSRYQQPGVARHYQKNKAAIQARSAAWYQKNKKRILAKAMARRAAKKRQLEIDRNLATALVSLNEKTEGIK